MNEQVCSQSSCLLPYNLDRSRLVIAFFSGITLSGWEKPLHKKKCGLVWIVSWFQNSFVGTSAVVFLLRVPLGAWPGSSWLPQWALLGCFLHDTSSLLGSTWMFHHLTCTKGFAQLNGPVQRCVHAKWASPQFESICTDFHFRILHDEATGQVTCIF